MSNESKALELAELQDKCAEAWLESSDAHKFRKETAAELRRQCAEIESLRAQLAARVQDGWKRVPLEPTDAMVQAAHHLDLSYMPGQEGPDRAAIYRAMLSAAPSQQAPVAQGEPVLFECTYGYTPCAALKSANTHPQQASEPMTDADAFQAGFRAGYERRDAEVKGALA